LSTATGSVPRSTTQKLSERVSVLDFDAKGNGSHDDTAAIDEAIDYCSSKGKTLVFPSKVYLVSKLAPFTVYDTILVGEPGARLKFTGTGVGVTIDGSANSATGLRVILRDLILDGNGTLDYCIDTLLLVNGELRNVRCTNCKIAGVRLRWSVSNLIDTLVVSHQFEAFTTTPVSGIVLDVGTGNICGGNTIVNPRIEGVSGPGIDIAGAQGTTIVGGTSEGNGTGILIRANQLLTTVQGIDCEVNTAFDFDIAGHQNDFYNCIASSTASVKLRSPAFQNHFYNGYYNQITIDAGCKFNVFDKTSILNPIVDNGDHNVFRDVIDIFAFNNTRNKQWADHTFNGLTSLTGGVDTDVRSLKPYPGPGVAPTPFQFLATARQASGTQVALGGMSIQYNYISDTDYGSQLIFFASPDNATTIAFNTTPGANFQVRFKVLIGVAGSEPLETLDVIGGDAFLRVLYPGSGATPAARRFFMETVNSSNIRVAGCGMRGVFTRISDADYQSALEFWTAHDNVPAMRAWITPEGRLVIGTPVDDGANILQVTGNTKISGNLTVTGTVTGASGSPTLATASAAATSGLTLSGTMQDVPGATVSLVAGLWMVTGVFTFSINGGTASGGLIVGTTPLTAVASTSTAATSASTVSATQAWIVTVVGTQTAKLQAMISGLATGSCVAGNTTINCVKVG
jgi:hypothetical protein